jgi:hypothetical protein
LAFAFGALHRLDRFQSLPERGEDLARIHLSQSRVHTGCLPCDTCPVVRAQQVGCRTCPPHLRCAAAGN